MGPIAKSKNTSEGKPMDRYRLGQPNDCASAAGAAPAGAPHALFDHVSPSAHQSTLPYLAAPASCMRLLGSGILRPCTALSRPGAVKPAPSALHTAQLTWVEATGQPNFTGA